MNKVICIYHGNCADGFTAAWAVRKFFLNRGNEYSVEYHAGVYNDPPPDVTGKIVIMVDFSYKPEVVAKMAEVASRIVILDHHKTAEEGCKNGSKLGNSCQVFRLDEFAGPVNWGRVNICWYQDDCEGAWGANVYALVDMNRSGAGIAWDFFFPDVPRPRFVDHVEDRDLWRFKYPTTRAIQAAIFSHEYTWDNWDSFEREDTCSGLLMEGQAIERKHFKDIKELLTLCQRTMQIAGHIVPVASLPYTMSSDAGSIMASGQPFAACYYDTAEHRVFSLRSNDDGEDVSLIAKQFGGGGHRTAAGFRVPRDHELAKI